MVRPGERIHVIGIAGSGAAGVALLMRHAGLRVDGCDADTPSPYTPPLEAAGVRILSGHDPAHLDGVERVAITPALRAVPDLPEPWRRRSAGCRWSPGAGGAWRADDRRGAHRPGGDRHAWQVDDHRPARASADQRRLGPDRGGGCLHRPWGATVRPGNGAPFLVEADEFGDNFPTTTRRRS